jgi:hypothetical protein
MHLLGQAFVDGPRTAHFGVFLWENQVLVAATMETKTTRIFRTAARIWLLEATKFFRILVVQFLCVAGEDVLREHLERACFGFCSQGV